MMFTEDAKVFLDISNLFNEEHNIVRAIWVLCHCKEKYPSLYKFLFESGPYIRDNQDSFISKWSDLEEGKGGR